MSQPHATDISSYKVAFPRESSATTHPHKGIRGPARCRILLRQDPFLGGVGLRRAGVPFDRADEGGLLDHAGRLGDGGADRDRPRLIGLFPGPVLRVRRRAHGTVASAIYY